VSWSVTEHDTHMARPRSEPPNLGRLPVILREIADLRAQTADRLAELEYELVQLCRDNGATWEAIGDELGIARQTAEKRFKQPRRRRATSETGG
jgi:hypothetical protein